MTQCQACGSKSQLFLCNNHIGDLHKLLADLPWWIARLAEAAVGQTRMGDGGRGSGRRDIHGDDDALSKCKCGHREHDGSACGMVDHVTVKVSTLALDDQGEMYNVETERIDERHCRCVEYVPAMTQADLRNQALRLGGINPRAAERLAAVRNTLTTWIRHTCEVRGIDPPILSKPSEMALWLAGNVTALASDETAGECCTEIKDAVAGIERTINPPIPRKFLGPCPTWNDGERKVCGKELRARADAIEVRCPKCRQTHNCNRLQLLLINDLERSKVTAARILELNRILPEEYRIPERTLRRWRREGPNGEPPKLKIRGYIRATDGHRVINRHTPEDEPLYLWSEVRRLRVESGKVDA